MTGTTSASAPTSDPRQKQQAMFLDQGTARTISPLRPSVTIDQKAGGRHRPRLRDLLAREIRRRTLTPATATRALPDRNYIQRSPRSLPLKHSTLSRLAMPTADAEPDSVESKGTPLSTPSR